jgi:hypothetical protein
MLTYVAVSTLRCSFIRTLSVILTCVRMLTYADVCGRVDVAMQLYSDLKRYTRMRTYADVCSRMLAQQVGGRTIDSCVVAFERYQP